MASPQKENGFTPIANELLEETYRLKINTDALRLVLFIMRKTYGWKKKRDKIALSQFSEELGMKRQHVCRNLNKLVDMKIILRIQDDNGNEYEINKNYEEWEVVPKQGRPQTGNKVVPKQVMNPVPKQGHTKETITKEKKETSAKAERLSSLKDSLPNTNIGAPPENPPKSPLEEKERLRVLRNLSARHSPTFGMKATRNVVHFCELFLQHKNYPYGSIVNIEPVAKQISRYYQNGETVETINDMLDSYMQSAKANDITVKLTTAFSEDTYHSWKQGKFSAGNKNKGMAL